MPGVRLVPAARILTRRNCAEGVAASVAFAVQEGRSGRQIGYVCLYERPLGAPDSLLCSFDLLRYKAGRPAAWIAQGDVVRDVGGTLTIERLAVCPSVDQIAMGNNFGLGPSFFAEPATRDVASEADADGDEDEDLNEERAALDRMAEASSTLPPDSVQVPSARGGVTSAVLRDVPLGWVHTALAEMRRVRRGDGLMWLREALQPPGEPWFGHAVADGAEVPRRRPGRPPLADDHLRLVAELALQESGAGRNARVGEKLNLPSSTVRDHIAAARRAQWLAPTGPGRRDVAPGPRLIAAWKEEEA